MDNHRYEAEKEEILKAVRAIMQHFPKYIRECDKNWPRCYIHKIEMCQILQKGKTSFYQCFDTTNGKMCSHKEFGI